VATNGAKYGIDETKIVISGGSAGGHLALMTAMADESFDKGCADGETPRAAGVINYYGATDMEKLLVARSLNLQHWFRGSSDAPALARRLSPLTWVRENLPPVLSIHGDADKAIPYEHSVRLHKALDAVRVPNELITISGGAHGRHTWTDSDTLRVQRAIESFLKKHHIVRP
jgi:acetyl esterase/lipase